jgi:hypothetical protein
VTAYNHFGISNFFFDKFFFFSEKLFLGEDVNVIGKLWHRKELFTVTFSIGEMARQFNLLARERVHISIINEVMIRINQPEFFFFFDMFRILTVNSFVRFTPM